MNKKELIKAVAEKCEMSQKVAGEVVTAFIDVVTESLVKGEDVSLSGFGKFLTVTRAARKGRNPQTGEEIDIPEKVVPKFKCSNTLKEKIQ